MSCIDSRLPPEAVFDQGIGDRFAVRTGAQAIDGLVTASIEYGPRASGTLAQACPALRVPGRSAAARTA